MESILYFSITSSMRGMRARQLFGGGSSGERTLKEAMRKTASSCANSVQADSMMNRGSERMMFVSNCLTCYFKMISAMTGKWSEGYSLPLWSLMVACLRTRMSPLKKMKSISPLDGFSGL